MFSLKSTKLLSDLQGLKRERILGKPVTEVLPGIAKDPADWIGVYGKVVLTGEPLKFENYSEALDKWFVVSAYSPKKGYFVASFEDITARKKGEEEIVRLASFPALNPNPVVEANFDGSVKYANPATKLLFSDLKKLGLHHPFLSDWDCIVKTLNEIRNFGRQIEISGHWYHQQFFIAPKTQCIRIYAVNIDPMKQSETALRESEQRWATTLASIGDAVIATDVTGEVRFMNGVAEKLTGWTLNEAAQKPIKKVFTIINEQTRRKVADPVKIVLEKGVVVGLANHTVLVRKDGTETSIDDSGAPIKDRDGRIVGVVLIFRDITERKKAEAKMQQQNAILEGINKIFEEALSTRTETELGEICLSVAEEITQSQFGFIGEINPKGLEDIAISNPGWEACSMMDSKGHRRTYLNFAIHGIYGRVLKDGKALFTNDPRNHPDSIGTPKGHPLLKSFLGVPLIRDGVTIGLIAVGNREGGYTQNELESLEGLALAIVEAFMRKRAEKALFSSMEHLHLAHDAANSGIWEWDLITNENIWSEELWKLYELKPNSVQPSYEAWRQTVHPSDLAVAEHAVQEAARNGTDLNAEWRVRSHGKTERWLMSRGRPIRDANGQVTRFIGIVLDITERKQVEQALNNAKLEWERTFDSVPDLIAILDRQHRIVRANKAMAQALGVTPEQTIGLRCYERVHGTTQPPDLCPHSLTINEGKAHVAEVHEDRLGGDFLVSTTPLMDEQGQIVGSVHMARNITARKQMEKKLEEYTKHLEDLVEERTRQLKDAERLTAIGETAGMVGHDLRNPLQTISGETYLAKTELEQLPESPTRKNLEEIVQIIADQISYMDKIVSDLQDFVRPIKPNKAQVNLQKLLNDTLAEIAIPKNIKVQKRISNNIPEVPTDAQLLKRVFINLVTNSIQAMPNGGTLTAKAQKKQSTKGNEKILISFEDTGVGIPEEIKSKIFKPLFTTKSRGQGFGLAVCKRVVEAHGGAITFESKEGKGTRFTVELPISKPQTTKN